MNAHHTLTEPSLQMHPRKGREGKGRGSEDRDVVPIHRHLSEARTLCGVCHCPVGAECPISNVAPASTSPRRMDGRSAALIGGGRR